jgi:hypothetical protein
MAQFDESPFFKTEFSCLLGNKQKSICCLFHAGFLLGLLFDPKQREDMFFQNAA